jgi:hypothetical protein
MRAAHYCTDEELEYARCRARLEPDQPLRFDDSYRVAHLPLIAPEHPLVIDQLRPLDYRRGRYHEPRFSLVLPVAAGELQASTSFRALERELRSCAFAAKIAWELVERRSEKLHVTLVGGLPEAGLEACAAAVKSFLERRGPLRYRLGGPFCGSKNRGRIYFTAYPEQIEGADSFALLQQVVHAPRTGLYLLGYYNFVDELTPAEASGLHAFLERWRSAELAELTAPSLLILATHDDLALESRVLARIEG